VDHGGLERLVEVEGRQQAGQAPRQHGLAAAGGAEEEQVVPAGGRHLERPLGHLLPGHVAEVERRRRLRDRRRLGQGRQRGLPARPGHDLGDVADGVDGEPLHHRRLVAVGLGDHQGPGPGAPGRHGDGQHAADRPHLAGERELADELDPLERRRRQLAAGGQQADHDGDVEPGPVLAQVGRGEADHHPLAGERDPAVAHRRQHPDLGLGDRAGRQPDQEGPGQPVGGLDLDVDRQGLDAQDHRGADACQHAPAESSGRASREWPDPPGGRWVGGRETAGGAAARTGGLRRGQALPHQNIDSGT
jgi:hypothetical protein